MKHSASNFVYGYAEGVQEDLYRSLRRGFDTPITKLFDLIVPAQLDPARLNVIGEEGMLFGDRPYQDALRDIKSVVPSAHILIVVRPQIALLRSYYDMHPYLPDDPAKSYKTFSDWLVSMLDPKTSHLVHSLRYCDVVSAYGDAYGHENVTVTAMNTFFGDPTVRRKVCERIGIEPDEAEHLLSGRKDNSAAGHGAGRVARRLLGPLRASQFLSYNQIQWIKNAVAKVVPPKKTKVSAADEDFVAKAFAGQEMSDLAKMEWKGMFL